MIIDFDIDDTNRKIILITETLENTTVINKSMALTSKING